MPWEKPLSASQNRKKQKNQQRWWMLKNLLKKEGLH